MGFSSGFSNSSNFLDMRGITSRINTSMDGSAYRYRFRLWSINGAFVVSGPPLWTRTFPAWSPLSKAVYLSVSACFVSHLHIGWRWRLISPDRYDRDRGEEGTWFLSERLWVAFMAHIMHAPRALLPQGNVNMIWGWDENSEGSISDTEGIPSLAVRWCFCLSCHLKIIKCTCIVRLF